MVVITAMALGIWSLLFILGFSHGIAGSYMRNTIDTQTSHVQVHHPDWKEDNEVKYSIALPADVQSEMEKLQLQTCSRIIANGMIASSRQARAIQVRGIDPKDEALVTGLQNFMVEGSYFEKKTRNPILISTRMAELLKLKIRSKPVITLTTMDGEITANAFKVVGIFDYKNTMLNEALVFVLNKDLDPILGMNGKVHEMAAKGEDSALAKQYRDALKSGLPGLLVESFEEVAPELAMFRTQMMQNTAILTSIVMLALIFGIINTMLMAVLERQRELGVLMAVGMKKGNVFLMVMLETVFLALIALPIGLLIAFATVSWLGKVGVDLSRYSDGLKNFGMSAVIHPELGLHMYIYIGLAVVVTALIGAIYPSLKAIRLRPVEAIRKV